MSKPYFLRIITVIGALALTLGLPFVYAQDEEESDKGGAEQDNANARLEWQRETNGIVTFQFRSLEIRQANQHNAKKNAPGPKW